MVRIALSLLLTAIGAVPAAAAQVATPEQVARRAADPDHWVDGYTQMIAGETERLRQAGLGSEWDAIRSKVRLHLQPQKYNNATPAAHDRLRAAHVDSTTNFIVRIGYRARHLAHPAQARTVVRAANIVSWGDPDAFVLFSPTVFVAQLVRIDRKPDNSADLIYRVSEPIKAAPARGTEFRYPLNGPVPGGATRLADAAPPPPNPAVWELSQAQSVLFFRPASDAIGNYIGPMPVQGERALPGYHSGSSETTLAAVRKAAEAQLCSPGYVPVASGVDLPHRC